MSSNKKLILRRSMKLSLYFTVCSLFYAFLSLIFQNDQLNSGIQASLSHPRKIARIYIGVYTYPLYQHRVDILHKTWLPEFRQKLPSSSLEFVSSGDLDRSDFPVRVVPDAPLDYFYARLIFRFVACLEHFINDLDVEWCLVTTDDVFIHVERLKTMLHTMSEQYNTDKDIVFRGEAYHPSGPFGEYIHGGCGYFLSREAARQIIKNKEEFLSKASNETPDDVHIVQVLSYLNLTMEEVYDKRMLGTNIAEETKERIESANFTNLPKCEYGEPKFGQNIYETPHPFSDLVVWHGALFDGYILREGRRALEIIPNNVYLFTNDRKVFMCDSE